MSKKERNLESFYDNFNPSFEKFYSKAQEQSTPVSERQEFEQILTEKRYSEDCYIAEGSMKNIIKYKDSITSRSGAVAYLKKDQQQHFGDFVREARLTARLQHPNIMTVYDIGISDDERAFFTMKFIDGEDLGDILTKLRKGEKSDFDLQKFLYIFLKICEAIAFAHSKNILHLDIKPENIQVGEFGEVLVCDWGLAKDMNRPEETKEVPFINLDHKVDHTLNGIVKGSPQYMSPEQAAGRNSDKDQRTDIYCLGAILYSLLTFRPPIVCEDVMEAVRRCITGSIAKPGTCASRPVPAALEAVTLKAMALNPSDRHQTVAELIGDIEAYMGGFATSAEDLSFFSQFKLLIRRHKKIAGVSCFSVLSIIIIVAFFTIQLSFSEKEARLSQAAAEQAESKARNAQKHAENENELRKVLSKQAAPAFFRRAQISFMSYQLGAAEESIRLSIKLNPAPQNSQALMGHILLGLGQFGKAKEMIRHSNDKQKHDIIALIEHYQRDTLNVNNLPVFIADLQKLKLNREIAFTVKRFAGESSFTEQMALIKLALRKIYKGFKESHFIIDSKRQSLKIQHRKFNNTPLLYRLKITHLDLSNTVITDIRAISTLQLQSLNIAFTKISNIESLRKQPIKVLDLSNSAVNDLNLLPHMPLEVLKISGLRLKNLSPLLNCSKLRELTLSRDLATREQRIINILQERCKIYIE